jgi:hypothetical protein
MTIAAPVGLVVTSSSIPNYVPRGTGTPVEWHSLGRINLGNSLGYFERIRIQLSPQVIYPIPDECTLLSTNQAAGVSYGIDEIVSSASLPTRLMPWDRGPTTFSQASNSVISTAQTTTAWTFTVPAGRMLWLAAAEVSIARYAVATTAVGCSVSLTRGGQNVLLVREDSNVLPFRVLDTLSPAGMVLFAGEVLAGSFFVGDTGGGHTISINASGYTFAV